MPKLEHWIIASKRVEILGKETAEALLALGAELGEGWYDTHQHVCVNPYNKEQIEQILRDAGCTVSYLSQGLVLHPELHREITYDEQHDFSRPGMDRWIVASKMIPVLDREALQAILDLGGQVGGGWCEVHQHICVAGHHEDEVRKILRTAGFTVSSAAGAGV